MRRRSVLPACLAALLAAATATLPAGATARFTRACQGGNFECTRIPVPLDRSGQVPGTISLYVDRVRGEAVRRRPRTAIFALAGGPGQGASLVTNGFAGDFAAVQRGRDLIVVDQRGAGRSTALNCPELERGGPAPYHLRSRRCAARLGRRRGLYTTRDSVMDLEAVRRRLGYDRITLFGVSYGTKVALAYALRYPQRVSRIILDSVVEPEGQSPFDLDTFAAMPRVFAEICRLECADVTRDLAADVRALVDRMERRPLRGPFVDPSGRTRTVDITPRELYSQIREGDFQPELRAEYPGAIRSALAGDPAPLLRMEHRFDAIAREVVPFEPDVTLLSSTLQTATLCEEAPLPWERTAPPADRMRQARERAQALPEAMFEPFNRQVALALDHNSTLEQCRSWPTTPEPPDLGAGPLPDVPVLVLEGEEDLRTPVEVGQRVAARFPRAQLVRVPKTAHSVLGRGLRCANLVIVRFFADRPVGAPCRGVSQKVHVRPPIPARLAAIDPAPGTSGRVGRTLAAVVLTLRDTFREDANLGGHAGGGLRGGRFFTMSNVLRLDGVTVVPGVQVSGTAGRLGLRVGEITVGGPAAASGMLELRREGTVTGRLGGRRVSARWRP